MEPVRAKYRCLDPGKGTGRASKTSQGNWWSFGTTNWLEEVRVSGRGMEPTGVALEPVRENVRGLDPVKGTFLTGRAPEPVRQTSTAFGWRN